ncbi:MAG TPA: GWxTD domain-containing protein [Candidatus Krumholzibacteria bacterium]|nr:GWxTD domain-containing protein [Candidatus Krumholzibacteria bacterium]
MTRLFTLLILLAACTVPAPARAAEARASQPYVARASQLLAAADTSGAIDVLEHSNLDQHADPGAYILLGQVWRDRGTIDGRLRSQHVLEEARSHFPRNVDVLIELGRTYFAQRFFPDAVGTLQRALDIDPKRCDARFLVGLYHYHNWKRLNSYSDDLEVARRQLRTAWTCDPSNMEAAKLYLYARYALADTSAREADQILARFPREASFQLYRGALAYDAKQYDLCGRFFERGLALLPPAEREVYDDLSSVLPVNSANRYLESTRDVREILRRGYWVANDPDPTTEVNERQLEHIYRVFLSDLLFSNDWTGRRGWRSDRGETFIKYGAPLKIEHSMGAASDGHSETWSYNRGGEFRQFLFVDQFLNGDPRIPYDDDYVLHNMRHEAEISQLQSATARLSGILEVSVFRDDDLHASLYSSMRVDADSVEARALPGSTNIYLLRGAYFDTSWKREGGGLDTLWTSQLPPRPVEGTRVLEFTRRLPVSFGAFRVAWSLQDEHARVRALARANADASRFAGDQLALSDVLLYDDAPASQRNGAGFVARGGLNMRPRVGHIYSAADAVNSYVEVYGLTLLQGAADYEVRYSIFPSSREDTPAWRELLHSAGGALGFENDDPVISQSFTRHGNEHNANERIAINIDRLDPGYYELLVEVMDLNSGQHAASHTPLTVEEGTVGRR